MSAPAPAPGPRGRLLVAPSTPGLLLLLATATMAVAQESRPAPFFDARTYQTEYVGPGRDAPQPTDLNEVRIAYFGPADEGHPDWGEAWRGASLAIEKANANGGHQGKPFRLLSAWSDNPWGSGVADLARLAFKEGVWAIVGGVDGATTHLAEQIAVKARLPLVSPGCTDPSVNFTNVAWMFTLLPTDDRIAPLLAKSIVERNADKSWAVVTTNNRDVRAAWSALRLGLAARRARSPSLHLTLTTSTPECARAAREVARHKPRLVLVLATARDGARIIKALRSAGCDGNVMGGASFGHRPFSLEAGPTADGVAFPLLFDPENPDADAFIRAYKARWGSPPDFLAANAYDATDLIVGAVDRAGLNRVLIRDALATLAPWDGVAGRIAWDSTGRNMRPVTMGVWHDGHVRRR
ncbi:MAG: ABC transporter substrate-binding protein [Vicinamibacteria bacterium]|nr:ABC transporter substrate-binding protein [Vicinamibacteria bacterium]